MRNYPFMSGKDGDVYGNKLTSIALDWDGPEGLYENYHKEFAEWVSMDKTVRRVESRFPMTILKNLQMYKRVLLNGKVFRIRRSETPIYNNEYGKTTLELVQDDVLFENM